MGADVGILGGLDEGDLKLRKGSRVGVVGLAPALALSANLLPQGSVGIFELEPGDRLVARRRLLEEVGLELLVPPVHRLVITEASDLGRNRAPADGVVPKELSTHVGVGVGGKRLEVVVRRG